MCMYIKCRYRRTKIGVLPELMDVVNSSATVNVAKAIGNMDGTVIVPSYDWTTFLAKHINRCVGIKSIHHLRYPGTNKGRLRERDVRLPRSRHTPPRIQLLLTSHSVSHHQGLLSPDNKISLMRHHLS